jgi:glycosyltransferase domain-containing protein
LAYLASCEQFSSAIVQIADGSNDRAWTEVAGVIDSYSTALNLEVDHSPPELSALDRVALVMQRCQTDYVLPLADDDFYLPDWLTAAIEVLDREPSVGVVHGHAIFFELDDYAARGALRRYFVHPRQIPPVRWLEAETPAERIALTTDGTYAPSVVGWYALQRTEQLRTILDRALELGIPENLMEYWLVFYQAVLTKTRLLDVIAIARQINSNAFHLAPDRTSASVWLPLLRSEFNDLLKEHQSVPDETASEIVNRYLDGVASEIRWSATRGRLHHMVGKLVGFGTFWRKLRPAFSTAEKAHASYPDARLPKLPKLADDDPAVELIRRSAAINE